MEEWSAIIKQLRNYPCVLDYTMANEQPWNGTSGVGIANRMYATAKSLDPQVIPTPLHVLGRISPVFSRFWRVFTVSPRRFQRAQTWNPGPRNSVKGAQTPF